MQRLIAKYGSAAHLAILAVAPLFLFPFVEANELASVLLWLCIPAAYWPFLSPSVREGETLRDARRRVLKAALRDPLVWFFGVAVGLAGVRALNAGISLSYDAELAKWYVSSAAAPILPGSVDGAGYLPFAVTLSLAVVLTACRHALGLSARMCFLLLSSIFGGVAAVMAIVLAGCGDRVVLAMTESTPSSYASVGVAFAIHMICGTVSLVAAFERKWHWIMAAFVFAVGGTAAGAFAFCPVFVVEVFALVELAVLAYAFFYASGVLRSSGEFKMLVVTGISLVLGGLLVAAVLPEGLVRAKLASVLSLSFYSEDFFALRSVLSDIALKVWLSHLWIGTGVGSFSLDFRFAASAEDWLLAPGGVVAVTNGWWQVLAERGVIGAVALTVPLGFLLFTYFRRLVDWVPLRRMPHPVCLGALLVTGALLAISAFDCSFLRADVALIFLAFLAVSAGSFPRSKRSEDGR